MLQHSWVKCSGKKHMAEWIKYYSRKVFKKCLFIIIIDISKKTKIDD